MKLTTYDKYPEVSLKGYEHQAWQGWQAIITALNTRRSASAKTVLVIDCYPGVRLSELENQLLPAA